jgi:hypothetical protein
MRTSVNEVRILRVVSNANNPAGHATLRIFNASGGHISEVYIHYPTIYVHIFSLVFYTKNSIYTHMNGELLRMLSDKTYIKDTK